MARPGTVEHHRAREGTGCRWLGANAQRCGKKQREEDCTELHSRPQLSVPRSSIQTVRVQEAASNIETINESHRKECPKDATTR